MHNVKSPPVNLDKYLEGDKKRYLTYEEAARRYSMKENSISFSRHITPRQKWSE